MTDTNTTTSGVVQASNPLVALAALAIGVWAVGEFLIRRVVAAGIAAVFDAPVVAYVLAIALAAVVLGTAVAALGARWGVERADWELAFNPRSVLAGVAGAGAYFAGYVALLAVLVSIVGIDAGTGGDLGLADASTAVLVGFVLANGVLVPIAEEVAWRGVVQTALTDAWGVWLGVSVTAVCFVAKHFLVDLAAPPVRVASLVVLAIVLGALRHRYGTGSSTIAHLAVNLVASSTILLA
jgi:membrane protease YdiL (CAAX protease family)